MMGSFGRFTRQGRDGQKRNGEEGGDDRSHPAAAGKPLPGFAINANEELEDHAFLAASAESTHTRLALAEALSASQPVMRSDRFSGRRELLATLIAAIEQQRAHVVLYGERGIGKTSLVHIFSETAQDAGYLVLYASCGVEAHFDEIFRNFLEQIPLLYHKAVSPTSDEAKHQRSFAELIPAQPLDPRSLSELLAMLVGTRVILILDEYDRIADRGFRRNVAELIKNLSDRAARVQLVLTGVASNLDELIGFSPSIRRNVVGIAVERMPAGELQEILQHAQEATGLTFGDKAAALILKMADGSPYLVRLIGGRSANRALDRGRIDINDEDVIHATREILAEWKSGLPKRVQEQLALPPVQGAWSVLIAAARNSGTPEGWFTVNDIAGGHPDSDSADIRQTLDRFASEVALFERADDAALEPSYRFANQGLAQFLSLSAALARID